MVVRTAVVAAFLAVGAVIGGAGAAVADAGAEGAAIGSPGFLSGNVVQIPVHNQLNVCGNSVSFIGALNHAGGNFCKNH
ncbi:chaplin [Streptomyces sp. NPDC058001]|uniref:chaplin n=1 Tax=Streptomyces sp. NPDC058001 TaxID=3346300 RepID=UPI0036E2F7F6